MSLTGGGLAGTWRRIQRALNLLIGRVDRVEARLNALEQRISDLEP